MSPSRPPNGPKSIEVGPARPSIEDDAEVVGEGGAHGVLVGERASPRVGPWVVVMSRSPLRVTRPVGVSTDASRDRVKWLSGDVCCHSLRAAKSASGWGVVEKTKQSRQSSPSRRSRETHVTSRRTSPTRVAALAPLEAVAQRERLDEPLAETDVGEHGLLEAAARDDECHVVEVVGEPAGRGGHARGDEVDGIPEAAQQQREEAVQLVAVATAPGADDLVQQGTPGRGGWVGRARCRGSRTARPAGAPGAATRAPRRSAPRERRRRCARGRRPPRRGRARRSCSEWSPGHPATSSGREVKREPAAAASRRPS